MKNKMFIECNEYYKIHNSRNNTKCGVKMVNIRSGSEGCKYCNLNMRQLFFHKTDRRFNSYLLIKRHVR